MRSEKVVTSASAREYFKDLLDRARESQGVLVGDGTEYYLVNLLAQFLESERLYRRDSDGSLREEPLALILKRALEQEGPERQKELRRLGDVSLYVSGFFSDHLEGKVVDVDYYVGMGQEAYGSLARMLEVGRGRDLGFASVFGELAEKFTQLVDLFNEVSERLALTSQQGLLRLYERFQRTGSTRLARLLAEQGMVPVLANRSRGLA